MRGQNTTTPPAAPADRLISGASPLRSAAFPSAAAAFVEPDEVASGADAVVPLDPDPHDAPTAATTATLIRTHDDRFMVLHAAKSKASFRPTHDTWLVLRDP
jgi:hypothetical protein